MANLIVTGGYFVLSNCTDPSLDHDLDRWFKQVHIPDMLATELASRATPYRNVVQGEEPHNLTIYDVARADLLAEINDRVMSRFWPVWQRDNRIHPAFAVFGIQIWRRMRPDFTSPKSATAPTTGILATESICIDPARIQEFHIWYDEVHVPDILGTGLYHTVSRFEAVSPKNGEGKYLALYQTDVPDPASPANEMQDKWRALWTAQGRRSTLIRVTARRVYRTI